jgi:hypothetical protein
MASPTGVTAMGGEALSERAQAMLAAGLAASSQATYASGVARFHAFCDENRVPIERREPASENLLIEFVAALGGTVTPPTIRNYLSAIRAQHIAAGFGDPLAGRLRLQRAMRGVRRTYGEPRRLRLPITIDILRRIMVPRADDEWQDAFFDAAITLGFFGFLRAGEFTIKTKRFAADIHPCIGDIVFQQAGVNAVSAMTFRIKVAKTDPFRQGSTVVIGHAAVPSFTARAPRVGVASGRALRLRGWHAAAVLDVHSDAGRTPDRGRPRHERLLGAQSSDRRGNDSGGSWRSRLAHQGYGQVAV